MPVIEILHSPVPLKAQRLELRPGETLVGRDKACDWEIPDPRISSRHVILRLRGEAVEILDQQSTNGTFLNGERIRHGIWNPGQVLLLGSTEMRLIPVSGDSSSATGIPGYLKDARFDFSIVTERKIPADVADESLHAGEDPAHQSLRRRMRALQQSVRTLNAALSVNEVMDLSMRLLFEALQCDTGYILLTGTDEVGEGGIQAHIAYEKGLRKPTLDDRLYSRTLVSQVLRNRSGFIFDSEDSGTSLMSPGAEGSLSIVNLRIKTALCCPIHSEGRVYGVIYLDQKAKGSKFGEDDLDLVMNVAGVAGLAIENLELLRKLRTEALIRDNLKRFLSPNLADRIISERDGENFLLKSKKTDVTVLFADIRGFTPLSETLSPMEIAHLLNTYFSEMCSIVFANGGTLDKFIGDCMMVLFNAPMPVADHETVAVRTALAMRQRLRLKRPEWVKRGLPSFQVGIGINTGEAVVGSIGTSARLEYTAIGDPVNIASRICGLAKADQVLVTDGVMQKVGKHFRSVMLGATQLKGKRTQVLVHEVVDDLVTGS